MPPGYEGISAGYEGIRVLVPRYEVIRCRSTKGIRCWGTRGY